MKLYLIQHGEAKPEAEDPERPLTVRGEEEVKKVSFKVGHLNVSPSKVLHSGKLRAKQTAEIMAEGLKSPPRNVEPVHGLNPNDDVKPWAKRIEDDKQDMMIVGHLPFLEKLASYLLCGKSSRLVLFRYGAVVCLEQKEDKGWAIRWILTPEMV